MPWKEWASLLGDMSYRRIARTVLEDGSVVSTVWIGLDHRFGEGPPLIFESMVFEANTHPIVFGNRVNLVRSDLDERRYATEDEARQGHEDLVAKWTKKLKIT